jgi:Leucine-rich repeat (LRR) protein
MITFNSLTIHLTPKRLRIQFIVETALLQLIDISENQVTEVQKLAFKDLYLVQINLSHNSIEGIESGAFENCGNVTLLGLSHNKSESIPRTAFDINTYATELDLSYNLLTDLSQVLTAGAVLSKQGTRLKSLWRAQTSYVTERARETNLLVY